jgi:hypothetical protein
VIWHVSRLTHSTNPVIPKHYVEWRCRDRQGRGFLVFSTPDATSDGERLRDQDAKRAEEKWSQTEGDNPIASICTYNYRLL